MKQVIKRLLRRYGYRIEKNQYALHQPPVSNSMAAVLARVSQHDFQPATVIDVGVATGTAPLYLAFPNAFHLLIEPLVEFFGPIQDLLRSYRGHYVPAAAGSVDGEITINVHADHLDGSSVLREEMGSEFDGSHRVVKLVRIDTLTAQMGLSGPYLLKVDTQGAELEVLEGSRQTLLDCELVLLEVSLFEFMKGAPQFGDVIIYMKDHGFVVYDIYDGARRPLDGALGQLDLAFVKEQGIFRLDHRYATPEQWKQRAK